MTINEIPQDEVNRIRQRLLNQIASMDEADFRVIAKTQTSLSMFIADALQSIARLFGYIIALPIGFAIHVAKGIEKGFSEGLDAGLNNW